MPTDRWHGHGQVADKAEWTESIDVEVKRYSLPSLTFEPYDGLLQLLVERLGHLDDMSTTEAWTQLG